MGALIISKYVIEIGTMLMMAILILTNKHLRKRDTIDSKRIFNIAILVAASSACTLLAQIFLQTLSNYMIINTILLILREALLLQVVIGWNLFVDYAIYKSAEHVKRKLKKSMIPLIAVVVIAAVIYLLQGTKLAGKEFYVWVVNGVAWLFYLIQAAYIINAIWIVVSAKKRRKPPTFLRIDFFIIPMVFGFAKVINEIIGYNFPKMSLALYFILFYDLRSFCMAVGVLLTWFAILRRNRYVDHVTGFYNKNFLSTMNAYMEKSGYPNGIGVYFKAPGTNEKLIPILDELKPADAEIFAIGKDEYLLMAGPQKESVIKLLIKGVKLKAAEVDSSIEVTDSYAIRERDESTEAFTKRLLSMC